MFGRRRGAQTRRTLIVFARSPGAGPAKTRLRPDLGDEGADRLYNAMFLDTLMLARSVDGSVLLSLAGQPDRYELPKSWAVVRQPERTFGQRMEWSFSEAFRRKADAVVLIGADLPHLPHEMLAEAFNALELQRAVVGPTHDGGYYLLGLCAPAPWLFDGIAWSTADVFDQTLAALEGRQMKTAILPEARDIDTLEDALAAHALLQQHPQLAPLTARALGALLAGE